MSLNANNASYGGSSTFTVLEPGQYPARVVSVIDLGLQAQRPYRGQEKDPVQQIAITYELVDEFLLDEDGQEQTDKPRWQTEIMALYSPKAEKAKSTLRAKAIDPNNTTNFNFAEMVGMPVVVTFVHKPNPTNPDRPYVNVEHVAPMRSKQVENLPELVNKPVVFECSPEYAEVFPTLPDWLQNKIKEGLEYNGSALQVALEGGSSQPEPAAVPEEDPDEGDMENENPF